MVGDERQLHDRLFACGSVHARELIAADRDAQQKRAAAAVDTAGKVSHRFYETQLWEYEPDQVDLPDPLYQLRGHLEFTHFYTQVAATTLFAGNHKAHDHYLASSQRSLAWALSSLTEYLERHDRP